MKTISNIISLVIFGSLTYFFRDNPILVIIFSAIAGFAISNLYQLWLDNFEYLRFLPKLIVLWWKDQDLRISFASLIRIKIDDQYVLIKSRKFDLWQPVGGVYKFFNHDIKRCFDLQDDNGRFPTTNPSELRLSIPNKSIFKALGLMRWFDSRFGREISPDREFREELIDTTILNKDHFKETSFEFLNRHYLIRYSDKFKTWEFMSFEIFEMKLTDLQKNSIKAVLQNSANALMTMNKNQIDHDGYTANGIDYRIGSQTKYIL